jgi:CheY-like chemotaxis protein
MNKRRILLVDDEPAFTRVMRDYLEQTGRYEVRMENNPESVVAVARAFHPDLVLMDVIMPDADGGEIASRLKADPTLSGLRIVFLTAVVSKEDVTKHGEVIGGRSFLAKPVDAKELVACIERELGEAA